jgi:Rad3-related DNA helicase
MPKTRSLADLFVRGTELTIDDGKGPRQVWVQKLNPIERGVIIRKADAARARTIAGQHDETSETYMSALGDLAPYEREEKVDMLVQAERRRILPMVEEEWATKDEWLNEDYLQGLRDAWAGGVEKTFINDPEDAEAKRVERELQRYLDQVNAELDVRLADHRLSLETLPEDELDKTVLRLTMKMRGEMSWIEEYRRAELWQSVRTCVGTKTDDGWNHDRCNHRDKELPNREDVDFLQDQVLEPILVSIGTLTVDQLEGKDLPVTPASST